MEAGIEVLNQPFFASGNIATAGGCLGSQYLACWMIARLVGMEAAEEAMHYVAPVGEKQNTSSAWCAISAHTFQRQGLRHG